MFSRSEPIFFDVRVNSCYKNTIVVQGPSESSPAIPFVGSVVFGLGHQMPIRKVTLVLKGTFKLKFCEVDRSKPETSMNLVDEQSVLLECSWDNLLIDPRGTIRIRNGESLVTPQIEPSLSHNIYRNKEQNESLESDGSLGSDTDDSSERHSLPNLLHNFLHKNRHTNSHISFPRFHHSNANFITLSDSCPQGTPFRELNNLKDADLNSKTFVLPEGNYELPFQAIIPGDICETLEGLTGGSISYTLEAIMVKDTNKSSNNNGGNNNITCDRTLRVFRTPLPDLINPPEPLSVSNIWPEKIQYVMDLESRYVSLGANIGLSMKFVPLVKGLKFGKISLALIEYYGYKDKDNKIHDDSHKVASKVIKPNISEEMYRHYDEDERQNILQDNEDSATKIGINNDQWEIQTSMEVPKDLTKITQDCEVYHGKFTVYHKLRIKVSLINRDGHLSELRSNLFIIIYVSPNITIYGKKRCTIFENEENTGDSTNDVSSSLWTPPQYEKHVFDKKLEYPNSSTDIGLSNTNNENSSSNELSPTSNIFQISNSSVSIDDLYKVPSYHHAIEHADPHIEEFSPSY